ncbi:MATE family efflux transporter [Gymnodinialimonas ulvae]|uniref:MATE family efflux transporter n=1 Tax=Gymnodinialimonas ulvae TaxID=3126504 RepID=UPI0030A8CD9F
MAKRNLTEGPVWRALARVSAPMSLGILAVLSIGLADAYFLGQLGGEPLAAVGFIYPVTTALSSLAIGLSAGANATISQAIGREATGAEIFRLSLHSLGLGAVLAAGVAALFFLIFPWIFGAMGAGVAVMDEIRAYVPIWSASFPFLVVMMIINAIFRAHGDAVYASVFMICAAAVNIALNPVLIFGWGPVEGMGTGGAALATFIGRLVAVAAASIVAIKYGYLRVCGDVLKGLGSSMREVGAVGGPAAFSNAINPAGMALVTAAVATLGEAAVAGFGAASRVQSVAIVVLLALSAGIGPVVGQNWGAKKNDRARAAVVQAWTFCLAYGVLLAIALTAFADPLARAFAGESEAAEFAALYLKVVGWSLFGYGILVTANAAMNARSKAVYSMTLSLARIFAIYLPAAWAGVILFGYAGILGAAVLANAAAVIGAIYLAKRADLLPSKKRMSDLVGA